MSEARQPDPGVVPFPLAEGFQRASNVSAGLGGGPGVRVQGDDLDIETGVNAQGQPVVRVLAPAVRTYDDDGDEFSRNLAETLDDGVLQQVGEEVLLGVEADEMTRAELISQYQSGLELLGLKIEEVSATYGQKRGVSRIGHPLLLEAMIKYHAGAMAEMLPAAGPAKIATTGQVSSDEEARAQDFADIFNYYLTEIATEFYPDTSQMLMHQGYCGNAYKKIFRCPMRQRPVSESVRMLDLIVSEEAINLDNALRVTHQFFPSRAELKRMMILGRYVDRPIPYASGLMPLQNLAIKRSEGLSPQALRPQDTPLHLYECDLSLDPEFFAIPGKFERQAPDGLPLPYKVTVHKDTRMVLGFHRNWRDGDPLYQKDNMYVRYGLVPGLGFHQWGFLHILGNQTKALRAIWRLLIDSGMFSVFPGGVKIKGARTSTNEIAPGPGEWVDIDVPGATDIRQVLMALPYKQLDSVFVQFAQMIQESAAKLGGTVEVEAGEGRTNVPVGTVMSQIEQSTQIMAAVHKGNHRSQKEELMKLRGLFLRNPQDLWRLNPNPPRRYQDASQFADLNLLPASDPNIPAQIHRVMQVWAMLSLAQQAPQMFDMQEVLRRALGSIRIADPQTLLLTPEQMAQNAQQAAQAQQQQQQGQQDDPARMMQAQAKTQQVQLGHQAKMAEIQMQAQNAQQQGQQDAQAKQQELQIKLREQQMTSQDKAADRAAQVAQEQMKLQIERERMAYQANRDQQQHLLNVQKVAQQAVPDPGVSTAVPYDSPA